MKNPDCNNDDSFPGCTLPPNPRLLAEGWQRRFMADARMAADAVATYGELGYEVKLEPVTEAALKDECLGCQALLRQFKVVYTRKKNMIDHDYQGLKDYHDG